MWPLNGLVFSASQGENYVAAARASDPATCACHPVCANVQFLTSPLCAMKRNNHRAASGASPAAPLCAMLNGLPHSIVTFTMLAACPAAVTTTGTLPIPFSEYGSSTFT